MSGWPLSVIWDGLYIAWVELWSGEERRGVLYDRSAWPGKAFGFQYHSRQTIFYSSSSRGRLPSQQLPGKWFSAVSIGAQDLFCGKAVPPFVRLFQSSSSNSISPASSLLVWSFLTSAPLFLTVVLMLSRTLVWTSLWSVLQSALGMTRVCTTSGPLGTQGHSPRGASVWSVSVARSSLIWSSAVADCCGLLYPLLHTAPATLERWRSSFVLPGQYNLYAAPCFLSEHRSERGRGSLALSESCIVQIIKHANLRLVFFLSHLWCIMPVGNLSLSLLF